MEINKYSLDLLLVPLSIFINASYHFYLWHCSKSKHPKTTIGANIARKRVWLQSIMPTDDKKAILGVQTFRNSLNSSILSASISIAINTALALLSSNAYTSSHLLAGHAAFGSQTGSMLLLKCSSTSLLIIFSFLFNSMAVGCIIDASFLINANGDEPFIAQAQEILSKGLLLSVIGNRVLYVGLSFLLWMFGPVAFGLSTVISADHRGEPVEFWELTRHQPCKPERGGPLTLRTVRCTPRANQSISSSYISSLLLVLISSAYLDYFYYNGKMLSCYMKRLSS